MVIGVPMTAASSIRIKLSDAGRASDLRAYFRRHDALAIDNENGTLDVHLLKPFSDRDDERALVRSYLRVWERTGGVPVELLESLRSVAGTVGASGCSKRLSARYARGRRGDDQRSRRGRTLLTICARSRFR